MGLQQQQQQLHLHVVLFPMMAPGHMMPVLDMAKLFASHGVRATIITTPLNVQVFDKQVERSRSSGLEIDLRVFRFPVADFGLPEGCESADKIPSDKMIPQFIKAAAALQEPLEQLLEELRPNCLVADLFFPWAADSAAKFGIPRLIFHGSSNFAMCVSECLMLYKPFEDVSSETEPFVVPTLPHEVKLIKLQLGDHVKNKEESPFGGNFLDQMEESAKKSFGVIFNSFYELEPDYVDYYKKLNGRKTWQVGPLSLHNKEIEDKSQRGYESSIDGHECLRWLDSKDPNSVIFVCFGSMARFGASQLNEIATGLEASGQQFIWAFRQKEMDEKYLPEGFEERIKGRGLVIRGWAPQVLILDHEAVGGFLTHCGWNSTLEGICGGVPMVTWPIFAEQFYNEKLVTEILRIGVAVGAQKWSRIVDEVAIGQEAIAKQVKRVMVGDEAKEMRSRAKALGEMAKKAVEKSGSSLCDLNSLIEELATLRC